MKQNHRLNLIAAAGLAAVLGSCSYYETPTAATPDYHSGHVVTTLPDGYREVTVSGDRYYSSGQNYYRPQGSGYVIVDSPYGATTRSDVTIMRELPPGYRVITRNGQRYYQADNIYYQSRSGGYVVVDSPF